MRVYYINLERHARRRERMEHLLAALTYERVHAVDGKTLTGPEVRDRTRPLGPDNLTRYELACLLSHRQAWVDFLAEGDAYACILEDDVVLSPDFSRFIQDAAWIPTGCDVVKIETFCERIMLARHENAAVDRKLAGLLTFHQGSAGYILSRRGAERLMVSTERPALPVDLVLFDTDLLQQRGLVSQLIPGLCIQSHRVSDGPVLDELVSSIQQPPPDKMPKPWNERIMAELTRPFRQLRTLVVRLLFQQRHRARQHVVPFR